MFIRHSNEDFESNLAERERERVISGEQNQVNGHKATARQTDKEIITFVVYVRSAHPRRRPGWIIIK